MPKLASLNQLTYLRSFLEKKGYNVTEFYDFTNDMTEKQYNRFLFLLDSKDDAELERMANQFGINKTL